MKITDNLYTSSVNNSTNPRSKTHPQKQHSYNSNRSIINLTKQPAANSNSMQITQSSAQLGRKRSSITFPGNRVIILRQAQQAYNRPSCRRIALTNAKLAIPRDNVWPTATVILLSLAGSYFRMNDERMRLRARPTVYLYGFV